MKYEPITLNLMDYSTINQKSVGYSMLGQKQYLRYGLNGLTGVHSSGVLHLNPTMAGNIVRKGNQFEVSLFVNQYPIASSPGRLWEGGIHDAREKFADWSKVGLKPIFDEIKQDVDILMPSPGALGVEGMKAWLIRSQDDIRSYAKGELMRKTLLNAFLSFPNITSDSFDCFFIPSFHDGALPLYCNLEGLSTEIAGTTNSLGAVSTTNLQLNGRYEIDLQPNAPSLERFIAPQRQNKAMWNFIEDLFGIRRQYAPLDFLYLASQLSAVKDFGTFVFDQILSFDQKPFVTELNVKHYISMQLLRQAAFNYILQRCPPENWYKRTKVLIRHPGISDKEYEDSMAVLDKYWARGSYERVTAAGDGYFDLAVLPVGSRTITPKGFDHAIPCLTINEVPTGLDAHDYEKANKIKSMPWTKTPRIFDVPDAPRLITWNRFFGYDGILDEKPTAVQIDLISPSCVKQIVPRLNVNSQSFDRFSRDLWPILIQQYGNDSELEERTFGGKLVDKPSANVVKYSVGLVPFTKGQLFGCWPEDIAIDEDKLVITQKVRNDKGENEDVTSTLLRYSLWK